MRIPRFPLRKLTIGRAILLVALILAPSLVSGDTFVPVAGPFVSHISPPAVCRGRTNRVEFYGRDLAGAIDVWTSLPGVKIKAVLSGANEPDHCVFDIDVPDVAPLGLYGIRLATQSGLSNTHLFLIDELPIQSRQAEAALSPNDDRVRLVFPAAVHANCRPAVVDHYQIQVAAAQRLSFEVIGNRFGKDYDPLVTIRDARGRRIAEHDNDLGLFFDCRFSHTFTEAGLYDVDIRDSRFAGDPTWSYVLRIGDFPAARVAIPSSVTPGTRSQLQLSQSAVVSLDVELAADAPSGWFYQEVRASPAGVATWLPLHADRFENSLETEPNDARETATPATLPSTLHGVLGKTADRDWFQFEMKQGKMMTFRSEARGFGSPADLELILFDQDGKEVRRGDDVAMQEGLDAWWIDAKFDYQASKDGPHSLCVRDMSGSGGSAFVYRVEVTPSDPLLTLRAAVSRVTIPKDNYQPIPLKITRTHFSGPVQLRLIGAPSGIELEPTTVPADVTEIVCRLRATDSAPEGLATLQIEGHWESDDPTNKPSASALTTTSPLVDRRVKDKDLRYLALRDDQLHLPPSLTNRFAVLVTPAASFDVELPEESVLITKYVDSQFSIATTRKADFDSPIAFTARGGQIGDESEERSNVFVRLPPATVTEPNVSGGIFNRILTNYGKTRVDFAATATEGPRLVTLNRTFELEIKPAFAPAPESATVEVEPGGLAQIRILANRTRDFGGAVKLTAKPLLGFQFLEVHEIPADAAHVDVAVQSTAETKPGNYQIRFVARGRVGSYEEEVNGPNVTITVKKPAEKTP